MLDFSLLYRFFQWIYKYSFMYVNTWNISESKDNDKKAFTIIFFRIYFRLNEIEYSLFHWIGFYVWLLIWKQHVNSMTFCVCPELNI